jgi:hypothetical protein
MELTVRHHFMKLENTLKFMILKGINGTVKFNVKVD